MPSEISDIDKMILELPDERIREVRDFVGYLIEKEKKRKAFEERVLKAVSEPDAVEFDTVEKAMEAIRNWRD